MVLVTNDTLFIFFYRKLCNFDYCDGSMYSKPDDDLRGFFSNTQNIEYFQSILDTLPIGISIQTINRDIEYENEQAKKLVGSHLHDKCYRRWDHIPDQGSSPCVDCPANISMIDNKNHKIFRKTYNTQNQEMFIEIQVIPILDENNRVVKFMEVIIDKFSDVSGQIIDPSEIYYENDEEQIYVSLMKYGKLGSQVIHSEPIPFFKEDGDNNQELIRLSTFAFIGLFQNNPDQHGLFGPLPVLDYLKYSMIVFAFQIQDKTIEDLRKKQKENCMLLLFFPRDKDHLFTKRKQIYDYINSEIDNQLSIDDFTEKWFAKFHANLKSFIKGQMHSRMN